MGSLDSQRPQPESAMRHGPSIVLSALLLATALAVGAQQPVPPAESPAPTSATATPVSDDAATAAGAATAAVAAAPADAGTPDVAAEGRAFETYVDGLATALLAREDLAGLAVSVVRDDRVLLAKGYGMASLDPARPADGETAMFRIGSVAKTFAYTAAMQLVAEGRLSLDDVANERLPPALALPDDGYAEPIRIRHLLTHTAGYEDSGLGHLFVREPAAVPTPEDYLVRHRPRRVRPPGAVASYSNYSIAVLGAVVAHVSGMSFVDYVEQRLTGPLGMTRTTFRDPLPAGDPRGMDRALAADLAIGYTRQGGAFVAGAHEFTGHIAAVGGASATASDMARWMRMHLAGGALDGVRVLPEASSLAMREALFRNGARTPPITHGFLAHPLGPYETWGHGGATLYFHTGMALVPAKGIGVFASSNTDNARAPVADFVRLVLEHLLPEARPAPRAVAVDAATLARYEGTWRSNRRNYTSLEKLPIAFGSEATIRAGADGALRVSAGGETTRYVPIGPGLFQEAEGHALLEFLDGPDGLPDRYVGGYGLAVAERVAPADSIGLLALALLLAVGVAVARLAGMFRREKRGQATRPGLAAVRALALGSALAWIALVVALGLATAGMLADRAEVMFTFPSPMLRFAVWLGLLAAALAALEVLALVAVWRGGWRAWPKVRYTAGVLLLAAAAALLWRWNLLLPTG